MKKKQFLTLLFALFLLCAAPFSTAHAASSIRVTLPDFPVTLNGQTFSNDYSRYPFLVYSGITYFPMTFDDCRLLGIRTMWSESEGLSVAKSEAPFDDYNREVVTTKNKRTQTVQIAAGKIVINGKIIDNSQEQYPFLLFRGVTYFPLTWRFAVDEFGWSYSFDEEAGLVISNPAVSLTCADVWDGTVDDYGGLMGTGNMKLACMFGIGIEYRPQPGVRLYNITGKDITLLSDGFPWEYQVYQVIGGQEELIYRKAVPFYTGDLPARHYVQWSIDDDYWHWDGPNSVKGTFRAVLTHPEYISYQAGGTVLSEPTEGDGYAVSFSSAFIFT